MRIGYGRLSARDQNPGALHDALAAAACDQVFLDKPGKAGRHPELNKALMVASRPGDQLVVTRLDRLGHSLEHLSELADNLQGREVDLIVLEQDIDTSTPDGQLFFDILATIVEFEQSVSSERHRGWFP